MARHRPEEHNDAVGLAIQRVLEAESTANEKVRESRQTALGIVASARERAQAIAKRVDGRISQMHTSYQSKIRRAIAELAQAPAYSASATLDQGDTAKLAEAAQRLAVDLTNEPHELPA
jgi:vacuolar-type H+-ATPase subunit H